MKELMRRLDRVEAQIGPAEETETSRSLRRRLEAGRRRVAEWRAREGLPPLAEGTGDVPNPRRTIVEILNRGRQRNALTRQALAEVHGEVGEEGHERDLRRPRPAGFFAATRQESHKCRE
jgi:hypothetical protein